MEEHEKIIKLKSKVDNYEIELTKKAAMRSELLKGLINDYPDETIFNIDQVNKEALDKIKEYLQHYQDTEPKEIQRPLPSSDFKECVDEWDNKFICNEDNIEVLENLILAANYMDIKPLLNLLSAKIALKIKGINTSTIRKVFEISNLNKKEKEQLLGDKKYLEENFNNI